MEFSRLDILKKIILFNRIFKLRQKLVLLCHLISVESEYDTKVKSLQIKDHENVKDKLKLSYNLNLYDKELNHLIGYLTDSNLFHCFSNSNELLLVFYEKKFNFNLMLTDLQAI